jgi:hypothetical protein
MAGDGVDVAPGALRRVAEKETVTARRCVERLDRA